MLLRTVLVVSAYEVCDVFDMACNVMDEATASDITGSENDSSNSDRSISIEKDTREGLMMSAAYADALSALTAVIEMTES